MNHMNSYESNLVLQNGILFGDSGCNVTVVPFEETLRPNDLMIFYVKVADTNSHTHIYFLYISIYVHTCGPCAFVHGINWLNSLGWRCCELKDLQLEELEVEPPQAR